MRPIRWKKKYLTGNVTIDNHHLALTEIINSLVTEANGVEHCQDLNALHEHLLSSTETVFKENQVVQLREKIIEIKVAHLPLPAKNGAACCHCHLCDKIEQQLDDWIKTPEMT